MKVLGGQYMYLGFYTYSRQSKFFNREFIFIRGWGTMSVEITLLSLWNDFTLLPWHDPIEQVEELRVIEKQVDIMKKRELEISESTNKLVDIITLVAMVFVVYFFSFFNVPFDEMNLFLKYVSNLSPIFYQLILLVLLIILVTLFQFRISGNISDFFSSGKDKKREYMLSALKDIGFKKGMILKIWPYYLMGVLILGEGVMILSSKYFSNRLLTDPGVYFLLLRFGIYIFINFLAKALIFFTIFDYFLNTYKSIKLAYVYSSLTVLITLLIMTFIMPQISIIDRVFEN